MKNLELVFYMPPSLMNALRFLADHEKYLPGYSKDFASPVISTYDTRWSTLLMLSYLSFMLDSFALVCVVYVEWAYGHMAAGIIFGEPLLS